MRRIEIIDGLRGIAIIIMLLFHSNYYWDNSLTLEEYNQYLQNPVAMIALIFGKFAGIFAVISGIVYTYRAIGKLEEEEQQISTVSKSIMISGLWVVLMSKLQSIFLNHTVVGDVITPYPIGPRYYTAITGSIEAGRLISPSLYLTIYRSTALFMIGMSIIWTGLLVRLLFNNDGHKKYRRNYLIIGFLGTSIVGLTSIIKTTFRPIWIQAILHNQYLQGFALGVLIGDPFPFFPFAGYTMYGMLFGMIFNQQPSIKMTNIIILTMALCYLGIGIYLYLVRKYDISKVFQTPEQQLNYIQIAMMLAICTLMYNLDSWGKETKLYEFLTAPWLRIFGSMTLTLFMLEPLLGAIFKVLIAFFLPSFFQNPIGAISFGISLIFLWYILLKKWQKYSYVGSFEWITLKTLNQLTNKPTRSLVTEQK